MRTATIYFRDGTIRHCAYQNVTTDQHTIAFHSHDLGEPQNVAVVVPWDAVQMIETAPVRSEQ